MCRRVGDPTCALKWSHRLPCWSADPILLDVKLISLITFEKICASPSAKAAAPSVPALLPRLLIDNFHDLSALEDFVQAQLKGIMGLEIEVASIMGKLKASQNRSIADRQGVVQGLEQQEGGAALAMADLVKQSKT